MRIFYVGNSSVNSTARQRAEALARNGHEITWLDLYTSLSGLLRGPLNARLHYRTGYRLLQPAVRRVLQDQAAAIARHDAIWIDSGDLLGRHCAAFLAELAPTVLICLDDPFGGRDGRRFDSLAAAVPMYDLCVSFRQPTLEDFQDRGARRAMRVWMGYDEVAHRPASADEMASWPHGGGIAFIGTWMRHERREDFLLTLMRRGVPLSLWGSGWRRSPKWPQIQPIWRGDALYGRDYCRAIMGADACLGLLSKGNRDQHTTRTFEVPFAGGLFVGERTPEHQALFEDGEEAFLWSDAEECADQCLALLANPQRSRAVRAAGMARIRRGGFGNETVVASILSELMNSPQTREVMA